VNVDADNHRVRLFGDFLFRVADWDWSTASLWCTDCGYDFVVYADLDHPGWYLLYNIQVGTYAHVEYLRKLPLIPDDLEVELSGTL
jgi:hypothetical protein